MPVWLIVALSAIGFVGLFVLTFVIAAGRINKEYDGEYPYCGKEEERETHE